MMLERDWQSRVIDLAKIMGYRVAHFRPAQTAKGWRTAMSGSPGWPDLVLLRPPRLILAELKVGAPIAPEQQEWLDQLGQVPCIECFVWRPADWDAVIDILRRKEAV